MVSCLNLPLFLVYTKLILTSQLKKKGDTCQTDVYVLNLLLCQQLQLLPQLMFVQKDLHFG